MNRGRPRFDWNPKVNFEISISGLAICSAASVAYSIIFRDMTTAIVGSFGIAFAAAGLGVWGSGHSVRRVVADLRNAGILVWPVYAQSDRDRRHRRGLLQVEETAVAVTVRGEILRIEWSDITSVTLQTGGPFRSGRLLVTVPTRGILILEILSSNAVASMNDPELRECAKTLNEFKLRSAPRSRGKPH